MSTPVFRVFIEIRGFLSFLKSVGLSNRFSNKLFLCLFLQRCNDQFGDVGISLQQTVRLFPEVVQWLFLRHISPFLDEIRLHRLCSISGAPRCCYGRTDLLSYRIARGWYPPAPWGAAAISPFSETGCAANTRKYTDMFRAGEIDPSALGQTFCLGAYRKSDMLYLGLINRLDQK